MSRRHRKVLQLVAIGVALASVLTVAQPTSVAQAGTLPGPVKTAMTIVDDTYACELPNVWKNECFFALDRNNTEIGLNVPMGFLDGVQVGGVWYIYSLGVDARGTIGVELVTTTDGVNFVDKGIALDSSTSSIDNNFAGFAGVYYESGTFYLYYECSGSANGSQICMATSTDGLNFTKYASNPVLGHLASSWESGGIGTPNMVKKGSTYYLFYHGSNGTSKMVTGVATASSPSGPFTRYSGNPVLDAGPAGSYDAGTVGKRGITLGSDGYYYMVYETSTSGSGIDFSTSDWSTGLARSSDLLTWQKFSQNTILPRHMPQIPGDQQFGNDGPTFLAMPNSPGPIPWVYYRAAIPGTKTGMATRRGAFVNEDVGGIQIPFLTTSVSHSVGRTQGTGWAANTTQDTAAGWLSYGAYTTTLPTGENTAVFKLAIDNNTIADDNIVRLEVFDQTANAVVESRIISRKDFALPGHYEFFTVPFTNLVATAGHNLELRAWWYGSAEVNQEMAGYAWVGLGSTKPAPLGDVLKMTVVNGTGSANKYAYRKVSTGIGYTLQAGDTIEYDVYLDGPVAGSGGIDLLNSAGTQSLRDLAGWVDQNGTSGSTQADLTSVASNKWAHRVLTVPAAGVGLAVDRLDLAAENDAAGLPYAAYYDNIVIKHAGAVVRSVFVNAADATSLAVDFSTGTTSTLAAVNKTKIYNELTLNGTVSSGITNAYAYKTFNTSQTVTLHTGDRLEYWVKVGGNSGALGGMDIKFTDGTWARDFDAYFKDQNGIGIHPANNLSSFADSRWYRRIMVVPSQLNGKTVSAWILAMETDAAGTYQVSYDNIGVRSVSTHLLTDIYLDQAGVLSTDAIPSSGTSATVTTVAPVPAW